MIEFFQWTEKQLIPHIPPHDNVLVIDGAPYHIIQEDTCQTMANNRKHILAWMGRNNVAYTTRLKRQDFPYSAWGAFGHFFQ